MAVQFVWGDAGFSSEKILAEAKSAESHLNALRAVRKDGNWSDDSASILLPNEKKFQKLSQSMANSCRNAEFFLLVGIGGSNLGSMAAMDFLLGKQHNLLNESKRMLFADTCDPDSISESILLLRKHLAKGGKAVINIVSKSGTTAETLANFEAIYSTLTPRERKCVKIIATTDDGSALHSLAEKKKWGILPIPKKVGGRYSVFSCVGLFPLAWLGADTASLLHGAATMLDLCLGSANAKNPALIQATLMHQHAIWGKSILDSFVFSNSLSSYGLWYRQLLAESCGKNGKGLTPAVSIGTTDMHSQAQLYLDGRRDKAFRFIYVMPTDNQLISPPLSAAPLSSQLSGRSTSELYSILMQSMKVACKQAERPYWEISLGAKTEENLGALMQLDMLSVILFCRMQGVNPFDQPAVEEYKKEAKRLLMLRQ